MWEDANARTSFEPKTIYPLPLGESVIQPLRLISDNNKVKRYPTSIEDLIVL